MIKSAYDEMLDELLVIDSMKIIFFPVRIEYISDDSKREYFGGALAFCFQQNFKGKMRTNSNWNSTPLQHF